MKQYLDGLRTILDKGFDSKPARTNMPATKVYNDLQMRFDLTGGKLPVITTKKMPIRSITSELLCFIEGTTDVRTYGRMGCDVWWDNAYKWNIKEIDRYDKISNKQGITITEYKEGSLDGEFYDLGRIYAAQWRSYQGRMNSDIVVQKNLKKDQLYDIIEGIKERPESRYHVISAWNPTEMTNEFVSQPNCHVYFQVTCRELSFYEREQLYRKTKFGAEMIGEPIEEHDMDNIPKYAIRTHLTQRSCDMFLGVPFNITSYSLFTHILARITNTIAEEFVWNGVNCHIYGNHLDQVEEQLKRLPLSVPTIKISDQLQDLSDFTNLVHNAEWYKEHFKTLFMLDGYNPYPAIKGDLSVGL